MFKGKVADNSSVSEEDRKLVEESFWMIRPCALYIHEYSDCTSLRGRFDQYYTNGKLADCGRWNEDRFDCRKYIKEEDMAAGARIIRNEKKRVADRLKSFKDNDVMKARQIRPPANWDDPLPHYILEKHEDSYLSEHLGELKQPYDAPASYCVIS